VGTEQPLRSDSGRVTVLRACVFAGTKKTQKFRIHTTKTTPPLFFSLQIQIAGKVHTSQVAHQAGFSSMKRLGVLLYSPLDRMLVHRRVTPALSSPLPVYTPGLREALCELSVFPKNTTQCPQARLEIRTPRSEDKRTNHETTAPP